MDMGRVNFFDASAYILFEACGDSEIDCFDGGFEAESDSGTAEDDAQSCSYESREQLELDAVDGDYRFLGEDEQCWVLDEEVITSPANCDEEDGVVDQYCGSRSCMAAAAQEVSPEDWAMSEQERGRIFWEKCLAS